MNRRNEMKDPHAGIKRGKTGGGVRKWRGKYGIKGV